MFLPLSIESQMNNKGIHNSQNIQAAFSAGGASYPGGQLPSDEIIKVKAIPFLFYNVHHHRYDNLELNGQACSFAAVFARSLLVLGASDNGDFFESLCLQYEDGKAQRVRLGLTNWTSTQAAFGETAAFTCSSICVSDRQVDIPSTIWLQKIACNNKWRLKAFQFDDNPFMHIFSVTLELENVDG